MDAAAAALFAEIGGKVPPERHGRILAERMALLLQGALLVPNAPSAVSDAFCATRLAGGSRAMFGILPDGINVNAIIGRHAFD